MDEQKYTFDLFLSHASEDKVSFVEPLYEELKSLGLRVWYDKFVLEVGDSLRQSIETGLVTSEYGVVIFSPSFFGKRWPQSELNGLFALEADGRKRILPVLHAMTHSQFAAFAPIQADKISIPASLGVREVAARLLKVLRPEHTKMSAAAETVLKSSLQFIQQARETYPGYDFRITPNSSYVPHPRGDRVASTSDGDVTIDILLKDAGKLKDGPPTVQIDFTAEGIAKIQEALATGRPQTLGHGEFRRARSNVPFFPSAFPEGTELQIAPRIPDTTPRPVKVVFRKGPRSVRFPLMYMRPTRVGTLSGEVLIESVGSGFSIRMTLGPGREDHEIHISMRAAEAESFSSISKAAEAIQMAFDAADLRIYDLASERLILGTEVDFSGREPIPRGFLDFVRGVALVEDKFGVNFGWREDVSENDELTLNILKSLITGETFGVPFEGQGSVVKSAEVEEGDLSALFGANLRFEQSPVGYSGVLYFLGKEVRVPNWKLITEDIVFDDLQGLVDSIRSSAIGETIHFRVSSNHGPKAIYASNL